MTLVLTSPVNRAEESLIELIKGHRETVTVSIQEKLKPGEIVEYVLAKGMVPVGPKQFQGAKATIKKMSIVERFKVLDRIIGHRKISFGQTVGGRHIAFDVRTIILRN